MKLRPQADVLSRLPGEVALDLTVAGFVTFGLHKFYEFGGKMTCACRGRCGTCPGPGKHPSEAWSGLLQPDFDAAFGRALLRPTTGYGVRTGSPSAITVLDFDGAKGFASKAALEARHGPLPPTWRVTTGRPEGGEHDWFALPDGDPEPRTCAGLLAPGVDVRGRGGMVVGPGSPHRSGARYRWALGRSPVDLELAPLPPAWVAALPLAGDQRPPTPRLAPSRRQGGKATECFSQPRVGVSARLPIGDGPGRGGFHRPIRSLACQWWSAAGVDADPQPLISALLAGVAAAPKDPALSRSRYSDPTHIADEVESARLFILEKRDVT